MTSSLSPSFRATFTAPLPTPTPTDTSSSSGGGGGNNTNPTSSPLLFFVALGFGVVFTNLWIIVGVKYCFRYNARQRARANGEDEPVDMQTMPRPHRRRREKKLMSLDEVNERFPTTKYKAWRANRERMGLPSEGGIKTAPNSRPGSIKNLEAGVSPARADSSTDSGALHKEVLGTSVADRDVSSSTAALAKETSTSPTIAETSTTNENKRLSDISDIDHPKDSGSDEEDDEHIHPAVPDELLNTTGDSCAICIDVIEDNDDIRGLTCGHAFHAGCLDPWLTSRRACCPLCKADYYTPKAKPEGESSNTDENGNTRSRSRRQEREPAVPPEAYVGPPFHRRMLFSGRFMSPYYGNEQGRVSRTNNSNSGSSTAAQAGSDAGAGAGGSRWLRNPLRGFRRGGAEEPTPAALEAGLSSRTNVNGASTPAQRPTPVPTPVPRAGTH